MYELIAEDRHEHLESWFWLIKRDEFSDKIKFLKPLEFEDRDESKGHQDQLNPFLRSEGYTEGKYPKFPEELVAIFEGLWNMGLRPSGFEDRNRETGALRDHLEDMRRLALRDKYTPCPPR